MTNSQYIQKMSNNSVALFKRKQPLLSHIDIELTERCNNACIHCYINQPAMDTKTELRELTTEQWQDIFKQAADLGALTIRLTGGEPLLREDFAELYTFARRLGLKVILFTNARLITPTLADLFSNIPPLEKIEVSVYGMRADSYDAVACSPGAFAEFRQGIDLLLDRGIPFGLKYVTLPLIKDEMDEYKTWINTLPGDLKPAYTVLLDLRTRRDSHAKNLLINSLRLPPEECLSILTQNGEDYRRTIAQFSEKFMYPQGDELFNCGAGLSGCVDPYGNYQMCMLLRHPKMVYNLSNGTLREGLTSVFPQYLTMRATNPQYLQRCASCFLKGLCEQCPAKSWSEHGTLDTPVEYLCTIAHLQARYLGLLEEGEHGWEVKHWKNRIENLLSKVITDESR